MATAIAGCAEPAVPLLRAAPAGYLLGIDQLVSPDFRLDTAPHSLTAADIAGTDRTAAQRLTAAGLLAAASEDFFRAVGSLALADGPVQIRDTVLEFQAATGAATVYSADVSRLDAVRGSASVSTGSLGDSAHATTRTAPTAAGVTAVEITVEWRLDNLLDVLVVRGREGGTRPDDALLLAHRQTVVELGLATPAPRAAGSATAGR
ncbi:MAG: hypothetical protein ACRENL_09035 [Candidatus Dormibacteria bacterium]